MKYFTISELCKSDTANKLGIKNIPSEEIKENLTALVENVLDPLREWYGKPIYVNSGYRCPELNKAVGSKAKKSQHLYGQAADIDVNSKSENKKLFDFIANNLDFDQLINESNFSWVHVSFKKNGVNRKQILML